MTAKIFLSVFILICIGLGLIFGLNAFSEAMENSLLLAGEIISASDISGSIDKLYSFEENFKENRFLFSSFLHDSELDGIENLIADIRSSLFCGERDDALAFASLLQEKLLQLKFSMAPSLENII